MDGSCSCRCFGQTSSFRLVLAIAFFQHAMIAELLLLLRAAAESIAARCLQPTPSQFFFSRGLIAVGAPPHRLFHFLHMIFSLIPHPPRESNRLAQTLVLVYVNLNLSFAFL